MRRGAVLTIIYVGVGGATGATLRVTISELFTYTGSFPLATLLINLFGSFALGFLLTSTTCLSNRRIKLALTTGLLGSFTTFSAFGWETLKLLQDGLMQTALFYVSLSLAGGLLCSMFGIFLARRREA